MKWKGSPAPSCIRSGSTTIEFARDRLLRKLDGFDWLDEGPAGPGCRCAAVEVEWERGDARLSAKGRVKKMGEEVSPSAGGAYGVEAVE